MNQPPHNFVLGDRVSVRDKSSKYYGETGTIAGFPGREKILVELDLDITITVHYLLIKKV